jgi:hypothetical protein
MSAVDETRLRQLLDLAEISAVQLRYSTGTDTRNWERFRTASPTRSTSTSAPGSARVRIAKCKLAVSRMTGNFGRFGGVFQYADG